MDIQRKQEGSKGAFFIEENGKMLAQMTYVMSGVDKFIIDHTEVSDTLRGKGAGKQMVESAVKYALENHFKIMPLCPFARAVFDKTPEFRDILF